MRPRRTTTFFRSPDSRILSQSNTLLGKLRSLTTTFFLFERSSEEANSTSPMLALGTTPTSLSLAPMSSANRSLSFRMSSSHSSKRSPSRDHLSTNSLMARVTESGGRPAPALSR